MERKIKLLSEQGNNFLGHIAVDTGTSQITTNFIENFLSESNICTEQIKTVGCDGTVVNTGAKGEIIRKLEEKFGRPLHWFDCRLHANELPLDQQIQKLDGKTTGLRGYTRNIGK